MAACSSGRRNAFVITRRLGGHRIQSSVKPCLFPLNSSLLHLPLDHSVSLGLLFLRFHLIYFHQLCIQAMKVSHVVPFAALSAAFIIPDASMMKQFAIDAKHEAESIFDSLPSRDKLFKDVEDTVSDVVDTTRVAFDTAIEAFSDGAASTSDKLNEEYFNVKAWLATQGNNFDGTEDEHGPPHRGPPHRGRPPHKRPGHKKPHHGGHKSNLTVYQMISKSKYTTKLAKLIEEDKDLIDLLNGTSTNITLFAPTDKVFEQIPEHAHLPTKEQWKKIILYHTVADFYPAGRVFGSRTIPTLLAGDYLSEDPKSTPQRLSVGLGLRGLTLNYYARIIAVNFIGSNGVIHGIDHILLPPPKAATIISWLPGDFSTLSLALEKTGLGKVINDTDNHLGGTLFAPSNWAFKKLGPKINGFLFSKYGQKYLAALLKYHVVANQTLYSDAFYKTEGSEANKPRKGGIFHVSIHPSCKAHVVMCTINILSYQSMN